MSGKYNTRFDEQIVKTTTNLSIIMKIKYLNLYWTLIALSLFH